MALAIEKENEYVSLLADKTTDLQLRVSSLERVQGFDVSDVSALQGRTVQLEQKISSIHGLSPAATDLHIRANELETKIKQLPNSKLQVRALDLEKRVLELQEGNSEESRKQEQEILASKAIALGLQDRTCKLETSGAARAQMLEQSLAEREAQCASLQLRLDSSEARASKFLQEDFLNRNCEGTTLQATMNMEKRVVQLQKDQKSSFEEVVDLTHLASMLQQKIKEFEQFQLHSEEQSKALPQPEKLEALTSEVSRLQSMVDVLQADQASRAFLQEKVSQLSSRVQTLQASEDSEKAQIQATIAESHALAASLKQKAAESTDHKRVLELEQSLTREKQKNAYLHSEAQATKACEAKSAVLQEQLSQLQENKRSEGEKMQKEMSELQELADGLQQQVEELKRSPYASSKVLEDAIGAMEERQADVDELATRLEKQLKQLEVERDCKANLADRAAQLEQRLLKLQQSQGSDLDRANLQEFANSMQEQLRSLEQIATFKETTSPEDDAQREKRCRSTLEDASRLKERLNRIEVDHTAYRNEMSDLAVQASRLERHLSVLKSSSQSLADSDQAEKDELHKMGQELAKRIAALPNVLPQVASTSCTHDVASRDVLDHSEVIEELKLSARGLNDRVEELREVPRALRDAVSTFDQRVAILQSCPPSTDALNFPDDGSNVFFAENIQAKLLDLDTFAKTICRKMDATVSSKSNEALTLSALKAEIEQRETENLRLKTQLQEASAACQAQQQQCHKLTEDLQAATSSVAVKDSQALQLALNAPLVTSYERQLNNSQKQLQSLTQSYTSLKVSTVSLDAHRALQRELEMRTLECNALRDQLELTASLAVPREKHQSQVDSLQQQLALLRQDYSCFQKQAVDPERYMMLSRELEKKIEEQDELNQIVAMLKVQSHELQQARPSETTGALADEVSELKLKNVTLSMECERLKQASKPALASEQAHRQRIEMLESTTNMLRQTCDRQKEQLDMEKQHSAKLQRRLEEAECELQKMKKKPGGSSPTVMPRFGNDQDDSAQQFFQSRVVHQDEIRRVGGQSMTASCMPPLSGIASLSGAIPQRGSSLIVESLPVRRTASPLSHSRSPMRMR